MAWDLLERQPLSVFNEWWARIVLAQAFDELERGDEANSQMALAIALRPTASTIESERIRNRWYADQKIVEDKLAVYRRLGMPEE